jgi:hypothetical protein
MNVENKFFLQYATIIPRGPKIDYGIECSCSNSCEKVIELLLQDDEVVTFEEKLLSFDMTLSSSNITEEEKKMYNGINNLCYLLITNREMFLPRRIVLLGRVMQSIQKAKDANLSINYESISVDFIIKDYKIVKDIAYSFDIQKKLLLHFAKQSPSIQTYSEKVFKLLSQGNEIDQYLNAKKHFYEIFKNPEIMFEKILVNHLFFTQFPFSNKYETLWDEFESFCGVFMFIRFLAICYMVDKYSLNDFVDVISAAFRLIDHTNFDRNVDLLLKQENVTTLEQLEILIQA